MINDLIWVLRAPCGCPYGASAIATSETEAWFALAGDRGHAESTGYTVEQEPTETAVPDMRRRMGHCTHKDSGGPRNDGALARW